MHLLLFFSDIILYREKKTTEGVRPQRVYNHIRITYQRGHKDTPPPSYIGVEPANWNVGMFFQTLCT